MGEHVLQRIVAFALGAMVFALPSLSAKADIESDKRDCVFKKGSAGVDACSRLLRSGRSSGHQRATSYAHRGLTYSDLKQYPRYAVVYHNRGTAYFKLKQYRRAIHDYDAALRLNPRSAMAYYNRGISYEELGRRAEAIRDYRTALQVDPNFQRARQHLRRLGAKARQRPSGAAPPDTTPRCRDVGGYKSYMRRTGKMCRTD